jgi:hypothetical protein
MSEQANEEAVVTAEPKVKIIIPAEKVTEKVKKERSEKQKEAFAKARAMRDENNKKRKFSRQEALKQLDEFKIQQEKEEEDKRLQEADELRQKLGENAEIIVQKKRGRKVGQHIPYKKEQEIPLVSPAEAQKVQPVIQPQPAQAYTNPYLALLRAKKR